MSSAVEEAHLIVLPGGGYATHAENEGKPIADWLGRLGIRATVLRYPLNARLNIPRRVWLRRRLSARERRFPVGFWSDIGVGLDAEPRREAAGSREDNQE